MPKKYTPGTVYFNTDRLRDFFKRNGWTIRTLAAKLIVSQSTIQDHLLQNQGCRKPLFLVYVEEFGKDIISAVEINRQLAELWFEQKTGGKVDFEALESQNEITTSEEDSPYEEHFKSIKKHYWLEFKDLRYWIDLNAIEINLQGLNKPGTPINVIDLVKKCIVRNKNALIYGNSGSGKTFAFLRLFEHFQKKYNPKKVSNEKIPLFEELSRIGNDLESTIIRKTGKDAFARDKHRYIIFLDGLNEVGDYEEQQRTLIKIARFAEKHSNIRIFITTQAFDESFRDLRNSLLYEIQPLKTKDIIKYLTKFRDKFTTQKEAETFFDDFTEYMKDFIAIPMFLKLLVTTYEKGKHLSISNPGELVREFDKFLLGTRGFKRQQLEKDYKKRFVPFLAFTMCAKNKIEITSEEFNQYVLKYSSNINSSTVEDTFLSRFNLMTEVGNLLKFQHQIIRDYFAAVYIKNKNYDETRILKLVYTNSSKNNDMINVVKLLVGITEPDTAKKIIHKFSLKDLYFACELFAWSSIKLYDRNYILRMTNKTRSYSRDYFLAPNALGAFYRKILDLLRDANKMNDEIYASMLNKLGLAYGLKFDVDRAIDCFKKAMVILQQLNMENDKKYATYLSNLGVSLSKTMRYEEAIEHYMKAIFIYEANDMKHHPSYAATQANLGTVLAHKFEYDKAIECFEQAISILLKNKIATHPNIAKFYMSLGSALGYKTEYDEAIKNYRKAISKYKELDMNTHPGLATCYNNLARALCYQSKYDQAIHYLRMAFSIFEENDMQNHQDTATYHRNLGIANAGKTEYDKAIKNFKQAIYIYNKNDMGNHRYCAQCKRYLGDVFADKKQYNHATVRLKQAISIYESENMIRRPDYARCFISLGKVYGNINKKNDSVKALKLALSILDQSIGTDHPDYQLCLEYLSEAKSNS